MDEREIFMADWGIDEYREYVERWHHTVFFRCALQGALAHLFERIDPLNTMHTYRACTACGNGVRHSYSVFLSPEEVLCYDCAAKEINRLREREAEWLAYDYEGRPS